MTETYTCDSCGKTSEKGWSDEEAAAEAEELFPGIEPAETAIVCDACYQHIMGRVRAEAPELTGPGWRGEAPPASDNPIGDALRADAEAARAEIRAEGIICPSCSVNMADLPDGHALAMADGYGGPWTAECAAGVPVQLNGTSPMSDADFSAWQAMANVAFWDDFRRREAETFQAFLGGGLPGGCYVTPGGSRVHVKPGCRCP